MTNSVDPDQTAPVGAVCSGSTLFAFIPKFVSYVLKLLAADDFSRQHFHMHFFLGADQTAQTKEQLTKCVSDMKRINWNITVLPAKGDSDIMFCLQSYHRLRIDRSRVY